MKFRLIDITLEIFFFRRVFDCLRERINPSEHCMHCENPLRVNADQVHIFLERYDVPPLPSNILKQLSS